MALPATATKSLSMEGRRSFLKGITNCCLQGHTQVLLPGQLDMQSMGNEHIISEQ